MPYFLSVAAIASLTVMKLSYAPIGAQLPFILYFAVVLVAGWYGGRGPGIFALVVSALVANYFFLEPVHTLSITRVNLVQTSVFVVESIGILALADLIRVQRVNERELTQRLDVLFQASEALANALTRSEIARVVVDRGTAAMRADTCTLYGTSATGDTLELLGQHGVSEEMLAKIQTLERMSGNPSFATLESGESRWVESRADYARQMPELAPLARVQAFWSVPLVVEGRPVGLLGMGFRGARTFPPEERRFVQTFARQCAQAMLRAERLENVNAARLAAEEARASLERSVAAQQADEQRRILVADATSALATSLDFKVTLTQVAALVVPKLADWCAIEIVDDQTGRSEQLAVAHVDPKMVEYAWELRRRYPPVENAPNGVPHVLRTGKSELYSEVTEEMIRAGAIDEEHLRISLALELRSALIVPLVARGHVVGAITLVHDASSPRRYGNDDLVIVEEIARRAAIAVDNARLYAAEQRARATADDANRLKDEFLATVSHELRTPLNAILGWSRMVTSGAVDESRRAHVSETIERNAIAMAQLIEDLLDVSRVISGKMRLEVELLEVAGVVEAAIDSAEPAARAKEITLRSVLDPFAGTVLGDPGRIQQIVWNLLSNAVKFTPPGGNVEVVVCNAAASVEISVNDSGAGIAPSFAPYVFDRFRQEDGKSTRMHGGLGLGLAITRHLVELHGGTIGFESDGPGLGTRFTVKLPITAVRPASERTPRAVPRQVAASRVPDERLSVLQGLRVLAVDDDGDSLRLVQSVLEAAGSQVTVAANVPDAMTAFAKDVPQVVVSDIGMPEHDGVELMRRIRALAPDRGGRVPAAALTGYARAVDRTKVLSAGYSIHLAKPVDPDELLAVVASLARFA